MTLDIVILPTFDVETLAIVDASTYDDDPPVVTSPTIEITPPNFDTVSLTFTVESTNIFNSTDLGISVAGSEEPLPDGLYCFKYTVDPEETYYVEKTIFRVDQLQEKFDGAFMKLDMMECDGAIKKQSFVDLNSIYFFIEGAKAAANNCATVEAVKLYNKANSMLDQFITSNCGCTGSTFNIVYR